MKKVFFTLLAVVAMLSGLQAENSSDSELVELAEIYRNYMFRNAPTKNTYEQLERLKTGELASAARFITETVTSDNELVTTRFLKLPDENVLLHLFIIRRINWNIRKEEPRDNTELIAELTEKNVPRYELVDSYYDMLFSGVANKNQPFDLSDINFSIRDYNLKDETERGVFFLKAMSLCGTVIWGYMNVVNPPNYKEAHKYIKKYPKFNGQPYYQYLNFSFPDFEMEIRKDKGRESYKAYYINKYYDTLLSHLLILSQKRRYKDERTDLLLGSILKEENYYKYSERKNVLESLFTTVKQ